MAGMDKFLIIYKNKSGYSQETRSDIRNAKLLLGFLKRKGYEEIAVINRENNIVVNYYLKGVFE